MGKKAVEMTALQVRSLVAPGLHFVGGVAGLALQVLPTGGRSWTLRTMVAGKRRDIGLGGFPDVPLAQARDKARAMREQIAAGTDPVQQRRELAAALKAARVGAKTFKDCATAYISAHRAGWKNAKHAQQWTNTLEQHVHPAMGHLLVADVALPHVLAVLEPMWTTKTETASRVRNRIELVLDWATARKYRSGENPARWRGHLDKLLPKPSKVAKVVHHAALPINAIGAFMQRLRAADGMGARALEFTILTAARSGEVRGATWSEIDLAAKTWTIPANRMKADREHRVPLSDAALELLAALPKMVGNPLVFPAPRGGVLSDMTMTAALRRMEVNATTHGFRSTFRDWAGERTSYPRDVAEMALAHAVENAAEAAYRRGDMLERRAAMMSDWAAFLARVETPATVVELRQRAA